MTLLEVINLRKYFPIKRGILGRVVGYVKAVDGVSFHINENEVFSLVGESGSGKTTVARCILRLYEPTDGRIVFEGKDITKLKGKELKDYRRKVQAVFQNPFLSLNPRMRIVDIVAEPLLAHMKISRNEARKEAIELLERVGLSSSLARRFPSDLSGGQAQRVAIARALALKPKLIILDEPTSALDVSVQAQILNLLDDLRKEFKLSYLLISHDLSVVRYISDYVAVMYLGKIVESAPTEELFSNPLHPYTKALLSAVPEPDPRLKKLRKRISLPGEPPSAINPPTGCRLHPRCPYATEKCKREEPELKHVGGNHYVRCWLL
ncbi:MAG: peptide ABC transporter substrate-binding protein [Desulfurococcales archaeon ex4484_42]|nr:MAG: peptide ABC transporter substrate-binding protein [Desulfurococcales archaeon ex4484_42]